MRNLIIISLILMTGCINTVAVKNGYSFDNYTRIGVFRFVSNALNSEVGSSVSDEFIRQLIKNRKSVVEINTPAKGTIMSYTKLAEHYNVDSILTGTVTKFIPDAEDTVYFKNEEGKIVSKVFFKEAQVAISAKLIDAGSGEVVWADSYAYSGFEVGDTINSIVEVIVRRMSRIR